MPHIDPRRRVQISAPAPRLGLQHTNSAGELTWLLTECIKQYTAHRGLRFEVIAEVIGALEQTEDEFRRLVVHPYEDEAIGRNGSAYEASDGAALAANVAEAEHEDRYHAEAPL